MLFKESCVTDKPMPAGSPECEKLRSSGKYPKHIDIVYIKVYISSTFYEQLLSNEIVIIRLFLRFMLAFLRESKLLKIPLIKCCWTWPKGKGKNKDHLSRCNPPSAGKHGKLTYRQALTVLLKFKIYVAKNDFRRIFWFSIDHLFFLLYFRVQTKVSA